jgi:hypothetical protein
MRTAAGEVMVRPHDIDRRTWEKAKREARAIMIATARSAKGTMTYNELASRITGVRFEPDSLALRELLGEISAAEDMAGRGTLSVVVVHQGEDCFPLWARHKQQGKALGRRIRKSPGSLEGKSVRNPAKVKISVSYSMASGCGLKCAYM